MKRECIMKYELLFIAGSIGTLISNLYGGWNTSLTTLLILMGADYVTGLLTAAVFKKSTKTATGALQSNAGFIGLLKKGMIMLMVLVACRLDILLNTNIIRDGVCTAFIVNEIVSLIENAGIMGVPIPKQITKAIDLLRDKEDNNE